MSTILEDNPALSAAPSALPADDVGEIRKRREIEEGEIAADITSEHNGKWVEQLHKDRATLLQQNARLTAALAEARELVGQKSEQYAEERAKGERMREALAEIVAYETQSDNWGYGTHNLADAIERAYTALEQSR